MIEIPKRSIRRHHLGRMKAKAAAVFLRWHRGFMNGKGPIKSTSSVDGVRTVTYMTPSEVSRAVAHLAETHCVPCSCWMCDRHKQPRMPHYESHRIFDLD